MSKKKVIYLLLIYIIKSNFNTINFCIFFILIFDKYLIMVENYFYDTTCINNYFMIQLVKIIIFMIQLDNIIIKIMIQLVKIIIFMIQLEK